MRAVIDMLKSVSNYPVSTDVLNRIALVRGVDLEVVATADIVNSKEYSLTEADTLYWLSKAPNISQNGFTYTFSDRDRLNFKRQATTIYKRCGEPLPETPFGYKGSRI